MNIDELAFKKGCQKWHAHLERCAKDGRFDEVEQLRKRAEEAFDKWRGSLEAARTETRGAEKRVVECRRKEDSIRVRMRMLGQLLDVMGNQLTAQARLETKVARQEKLAQEQAEEAEKKEKKEKEEREKRLKRERAAEEEEKAKRIAAAGEGQPGGNNE